jgi:dipeptidyl aminopeptidase/acylaminoacyl peptidase
MMKSRWAILLVLTSVCAALPISGQQKYQRPPKEIVDVLDAQQVPFPFPAPTGDAMLLATPLRYPPISDLAEPLLRLAGVRINPRNNGVHGSFYYVRYALKRLPDGPEVPIALPAGARVGSPRWNPSGSMFAFVNIADTAVELWIGDSATAKVRRVDGVRLNPVLGYVMAWMPDQKTLLVKTVPSQRGAPPPETSAPIGPRVEESGSVATASSTYEARDLLRNPHDADLFEYYATSQVALVDAASGTVTAIGGADVLSKLQAAPGGQHVLVERVRRPYSFIRPYNRFPTEVEVWDIAGKKVATLASQPLAEQVPVNGVRTGPREHGWRRTAPATVVWVEALDEGDTYKKVPHHDRIMVQPMGGSAAEWFQTEQRFAGLDWIDRGGAALLWDYDDDKHWVKTFLVDADNRATAPRLVWSQNSDDRYHDPGNAVYRMLPNGVFVVREFQGAIFMFGGGASPEGNRPFLDRLDLRTLKSERLFRSGRENLESFLDWVNPTSGTFLTRRESPADPPNVYLRTVGKAVS